MSEIKQEVQQFYDQVGWQLIGDDDGEINRYQNARYEDLRPVSRAYVHRCHLRVARHLKPAGHLLLDAGSGPVQYPEYLEYARGYQYRVCADISITALKEARKRVGDGGLYVVADVANLPFKPEAFDGVVSLHTIHHLPEEEHLQAFGELFRVLAPASNAVVVHGWPESRLMQIFEPFVRLGNRLRHLYDRRRMDNRRRTMDSGQPTMDEKRRMPTEDGPKGTFTSRHDVAWVKREVGGEMPLEIMVWRSVSVRFLRALIHPRLGGRLWLSLLYWLEEQYPHFFGEKGKYPLIVIRKE